jgi:Ca2+/Na+ antiporter
MAVESFRQAFIFALVVLVALWLQSIRVLTWWNIVLLVFVATFLEFVILLFRGNHNQDSN